VTVPSLLIVEDEGAFRELITMALTFEGYEVRSVENGWEVLETMRKSQPDLLILDLSMPRFSGWDILHSMRADPLFQHIPVLVITANADEVTRRRAQTERVDGLLIKPVDIQEILAALQRILGRLNPGG